MSGANFVDDISRHRGQVPIGIIRYNKILLVLPVLFRLMNFFLKILVFELHGYNTT